jgi:hypothetical protein
MLLSENTTTCAFDRVAPLLITEAMVRGENPHTTDWLRFDLDREDLDGEGAGSLASPATPVTPASPK